VRRLNLEVVRPLLRGWLLQRRNLGFCPERLPRLIATSIAVGVQEHSA
jgi:hypothetical protein